MLWTCSTDHRRGHLRRQKHVLTIRLLDTGPPQFPRQINHRAIAYVPALRPEFLSDDSPDLGYQSSVPSGSHSYAGREHCCAYGHMTVRRLLGKHHRNPQTAMLNGITLNLVVSLRGQTRIKPVLKCLPGPRISPERSPKHSTVLAVNEILIFLRHRHGVLPYLLIHRPAKRTDDLSDLLLQCHLTQQRIRPLLGGQ